MQVLILAAGKGERMRPLTLFKPKPLLEVAGIPLIEHHISNLKQAGFDDIVINVSWLGQQIMQRLGGGGQYGVKIRYSVENPEPLETGGGIFQALSLLDDTTFLVVNADIKTDIDFTKIKMNDNLLAHLILVHNPEHHKNGDFAIDANNYLAYKTNYNKYTYSGVGIYHRQLFANCQAGKFSVVPLLKQAMHNKLVTGELYAGQWDDIGTIKRLTEINLQGKQTYLSEVP
ncbi:MAG: nucleotidyltransferase family protein [Proteobacteria bacterium]|nr:nucleotidyltransferase family protein [Pseudomonadota bacterium]